MEFKVLVLRAAPYSITEGGRTNEGVSVTYIPEGSPNTGDRSRGHDVVQASLPLTQAPALVNVPGVYSFRMGTKAVKNARGKSELTLVPEYATFLHPVDLFGDPGASSPGDSVSALLRNGAGSTTTAGAGK